MLTNFFNKKYVILVIIFFTLSTVLLIINHGKRNNYNIKYSHIQLKRQSDLHFRIKGKINQIPVIFLLDTGASYVAVSPLIAKIANLKKIESTIVSTAGGNNSAYLTIIKQIKIGNIYIKNVKAIIAPGMMDYEVLLGQNVLQFFKVSLIGNDLSMTTISS
jgi:aspartyl protease family protein